jgi:hypothetical protein
LATEINLSSKQNCNDACQEDPIESAGPTYGGDGRAQSLESVDIQQISADKGSKASSNVGEGRSGTARNQKRCPGRRKRRNKDWYGDPQPRHRLSQPVDNGCYDRHAHQALDIKFVF